MIRNGFVILLLFVLCEGFFLLPEKMVIPFPGVFRMADTIFLILPLFLLMCSPTVLRLFHRFREESMWIITACLLVLLGPLMAWLFFDQPYLTGLLLMRHNLIYLTVFLFIVLLNHHARMESLLKILTFMFCIYIVILLVNYFFPNLELIHLRSGYEEKKSYMRFGESRLFFPFENLPILLYCFNFAVILHPTGKMSALRKTSILMFILIFLYAILCTFIRILFVSLLFTTVFALFTSNRRMLRNMAIVLTILFICLEGLAVAVSGSGLSFIEDSKLGKMVMQSGKLPPETARKFQVSMYLNQFIKSPLIGVGNIRSGTTPEEALRSYRRHGFFNGVDIGYLKVAAEYGIVGMAWVVWFYSYMYRRSKQTLAMALALRDEPMAEAVARGLRYFLIYLAISGLTLPHFVFYDFIPAIVLALAIMAVTRESLRLRIDGAAIA